jgi:hypothetical protein
MNLAEWVTIFSKKFLDSVNSAYHLRKSGHRPISRGLDVCDFNAIPSRWCQRRFGVRCVSLGGTRYAPAGLYDSGRLAARRRSAAY